MSVRDSSLPRNAPAQAGATRTQAPIALMAADRRDLARAALFLWTIFLSAMLSIVLWACLNTLAAAALSPPAMALRTALTAVRRRERSAELCAF